MINITLFENYRKPVGKRVSFERLSSTDWQHRPAEAKDDCKVFFPGVSPDNRRLKDSIESLSCLVLDIDQCTPAQQTVALRRLERFEWLYYTTWSHRPTDPRFRLVFPLKTAVSPEDYLDTWHAMNAFVGNICDEQGAEGWHVFNIPICNQSAPLGHDVKVNRGDYLDPDNLPGIRSDVAQWIKAQRSQKWEAVLNGMPFATEGSRNKSSMEMTWALRCEFDDLTDDELATIFQCSVTPMVSDDTWTMKTIIEQYRRALNKKPPEPGKRKTITTSPTAEDGRPWLVNSGKGYYILNPEGGYLSAVASEAQFAIDNRLGDLIKTRNVKKGGAFTMRPLNETLAEYGQHANGVEISTTIPETYYDFESRTLHESACQVRKDLVPRFNEKIDGWLKSLAGKHYESLCDWLACAPDLEKLLCGIYFKGPANGAKSNFAHWLSRIWTRGGPLELRTYVKGWHDYLIQCPVIFGDEKIPGGFGAEDITEEIRAMITSKTRNLNRKFKDTASMQGAVRLILAANNDTLLTNAQIKTKDDLEAVAQRILYIEFENAPVDYLKALGRENWWNDDALACHALYLQEHRKVEPPNDRLWVTGTETKLHRILLAKSYWNSQVCEVLCRILRHPETYKKCTHEKDKSRLVVPTGEIKKAWSIVHAVGKKPTTEILVRALTALSRGRVDGSWDIDLSIVKEWGDYAGIEY